MACEESSIPIWKYRHIILQRIVVEKNTGKTLEISKEWQNIKSKEKKDNKGKLATTIQTDNETIYKCMREWAVKVNLDPFWGRDQGIKKTADFE